MKKERVSGSIILNIFFSGRFSPLLSTEPTLEFHFTQKGLEISHLMQYVVVYELLPLALRLVYVKLLMLGAKNPFGGLRRKIHSEFCCIFLYIYIIIVESILLCVIWHLLRGKNSLRVLLYSIFLLYLYSKECIDMYNMTPSQRAKHNQGLLYFISLSYLYSI